MKILQSQTSYTHAGEYFSKLSFLCESVKENNILLILSDAAEIRKYLKIADDIKLKAQNLESYARLSELTYGEKKLFLCTIEMLEIPLSQKKCSEALSLTSWASYKSENLYMKLQDLGFEHHEFWKNNSYFQKWDTLSLCYENTHYSLSFWGDEIESIQTWQENISELQLFSVESLWSIEERGKTWTLKEHAQENNIFCIFDTLEFHEKYEIYTQELRSSSFNILKNTLYTKQEQLDISTPQIWSLEALKESLSETKNISIYTRYPKIIQGFLDHNNLGHIACYGVKNHLMTSFSSQKSLYLCDDILGKIFVKRRVKKKLSQDIDILLKIQNGDYVVHIDHGVGIFVWIVRKELGNIEREYLEIHYKDNGKLFVPIDEVQRISKYVGSENPPLTPLSGKIWEKKMKKVHENVREIAESILKNFAERKLRSGNKNILFPKSQTAFTEAFPYTHTLDQDACIQDIFSDMTSEKNMDRLLVGDVWFGKTEVAFQASYLALLNKKQVLLISPLVVLAHEHYQSALKRFAWFWVRIGLLTRLQSQSEAKKIMEWYKNGSIDLLIGTHRLLSEKLSDKNLGLLVIDEEHKFGVGDKEKIKKMKSQIDILSLSATPIPRSLNLALSGVRDISLLKTPPTGRKSIDTSVIEFNEALILEAGKREFERGGQIFFVHNRVMNIEVIKKQLETLFPKKKVIITHGQLPGDELEDRILAFKEKKYDILLSTTVIENGIDFPNVNTIFINESQAFGISQIHQLRGRVGRSEKQGYCYLLYKKEKLTEESAKRIQTLVDYSYLWAGFELAMKDLEVRGGGDILGVRQSGQVQEVGVSLFLKMLEEKIEELKQEKQNRENTEQKKEEKRFPPAQIDLMISAYIPDEYFLNETDKLNFYREIEVLEREKDIELLQEQFFANAWEIAPESAQNLFFLLSIQILAQKYHISKIRKAGKYYIIEFHDTGDIEHIKSFLAHDSEVVFQIIDGTKIRSQGKVFANEIKFLEYLALLLKWKLEHPKIKLISRAS